MKKLLVIVGPTAVGKTALAANFARKLNGEIVSADSRQVYIGMDIGTGKDKPNGVNIWGYDLVGPKQDFSVADYLKFADKKIAEIQGRGKLPILTGGTGFYVSAVVDGIDTASIPKNEKLRKELSELGADKLFEILKNIAPKKANSLNTSDKKNPARLVRAIEIAKSDVKATKEKLPLYDLLMIGLCASKEDLEKRISDRVEKRIEDGFEKEVEGLLKNGLTWENQSMNALGYRQWKAKDKKVAIKEWKAAERKYAKRQMTWFKKDKRVKWFDATDKNYAKNVEDAVNSWYSKDNGDR